MRGCGMGAMQIALRRERGKVFSRGSGGQYVQVIIDLHEFARLGGVSLV
jgi:hypothetical protein